MWMTDLIAGVLRGLTRDGWLLFVTRLTRLVAYGYLSVILVFYLVSLGLSESQTGLLLSLTLAGDVAISLFLTTQNAEAWLGNCGFARAVQYQPDRRTHAAVVYDGCGQPRRAVGCGGDYRDSPNNRRGVEPVISRFPVFAPFTGRCSVLPGGWIENRLRLYRAFVAVLPPEEVNPRFMSAGQESKIV